MTTAASTTPTPARPSKLPPEFADLEEFSDWCLGSEAERYAKRLASSMQEIQAFYDAITARAEEAIAYNMPTFKQHGRSVLHFAGWQKHYSLYPATARVLSTLRAELARYEIESGTIRFPLSEPVPLDLITNIAQLRAAEEAERALPLRRQAKG